MQTTSLPTDPQPVMDEFLALARTSTFSDVERDRNIVRLDFSGERWSYPKSEYYTYDDPVTVERRSIRVQRFLSRIADSVKW